MSHFVNREHLLNEEYKDASRLNSRLEFFERFSVSHVDQYRWIFDHFDLKAGSRILELGCGPGFLWQKNLDRLPPDWTITLSDFSPGMLQEAQRNLQQKHANMTFQLIDVQAIPLDDARFDAVIANNMLYHVPDRQKALSEIHRILKPSGHFYTSTFAQTSFSEIKRLIEQNCASPWLEPLEFSLEDGAEQLSFWFAHVDLDHLQNVLLITETEPLLQLICSDGDTTVDEEQIQSLHAAIDQELRQHGIIRMVLDHALFLAYGPK